MTKVSLNSISLKVRMHGVSWPFEPTLPVTVYAWYELAVSADFTHNCVCVSADLNHTCVLLYEEIDDQVEQITFQPSASTSRHHVS